MRTITQEQLGLNKHISPPCLLVRPCRPVKRTSHKQHLQHRRASEKDSDLSQLDSLKGDLDRLRLKEKAAGQGRQELSGADADSRSESTVKNLIDKVLIADFFFVCAAGAWLAAGVVEKTSLNSSKLLDAWYPLWMLVFQPAIGVLMLGALVSGGLGWLKGKNAS